MDYKQLQKFTREIIFRCHLATPSSDEELKLHHDGVTLETFTKTIEALNNLDEDKINGSSTETIINAVLDKYKMDEATLKQKTRKRHIVEARQMVMHMLEKNTSLSLTEIGWMMGRYHHSTVSHAIKAVDNLKATNRKFASDFREITNSITCQ